MLTRGGYVDYLPPMKPHGLGEKKIAQLGVE